MVTFHLNETQILGHFKCYFRVYPIFTYLNTDGQAHDLNGSDVLLDLSLSQTWLMDKAYNSRDRVIDPILEAKGQVVMPAKSNSIDQRDYDRHLYKARHLIENFFAKLKQYRAIATRYDKLAQNFLSAIYLASTIIWLN